ncbi:MAG TPA: hypoxanthine phosphoribosyltransferase [Symbiobacteriaceae bacterium]|jgi:hypoxanthine phosphoribosyltransferase
MGEGWDRLTDIAVVLYDEATIREKVEELAANITADYRDRMAADPKWNLLVVSVLRGSVFFLTDLVRAIELPVTMDFMALAAYRSPGRVQILKDLEDDIQDRDVLVVEDIIDTGLTLRYLLHQLAARGPRSLTVATFIDRSGLRLVPDLPIGYRGFDVKDLFVVGYGLDFRERYRNLPFIGVLKDEAMAEEFERPRFAHPSEVEFAQLLDFYRIRWEYEPRTFVLREDDNGHVEVGFSPDFYLPDFDLFIEVTTKKPHLMNRKLRQVEALRRQYPGVQVELLERTNFNYLAKKLKGRERD